MGITVMMQAEAIVRGRFFQEEIGRNEAGGL